MMTNTATTTSFWGCTGMRRQKGGRGGGGIGMCPFPLLEVNPDPLMVAVSYRWGGRCSGVSTAGRPCRYVHVKRAAYYHVKHATYYHMYK